MPCPADHPAGRARIDGVRPLGHLIAEHAGWRGAVFAYAGFALATIPLHLAIPEGRYGDVTMKEAAPAPQPLALSRADRRWPAPCMR